MNTWQYRQLLERRGLVNMTAIIQKNTFTGYY